MKAHRILIWTGCLALAGALNVWAGEKKEDVKDAARQSEKTQVDQSVERITLKNQANCPVMGGVIDSATYTDLQGQRVYHCCPMCTKKLLADPEHYFQQAARGGVLFENIQTKCPVSEMKLNDSVFTDYVGRRIYFGSEECRTTFLKDPAMYLSRLPGDQNVGHQPNHLRETTGAKGAHGHKDRKDN